MLAKALTSALMLATLLVAGCAATSGPHINPGQPAPRCGPDQYVNASCSGGPPI